ncbi:MAG: hypothetical protein HOQ02_10840 [Lysobacter sp.]|nr:hypothetical protein [Lysobacter sp.]
MGHADSGSSRSLPREQDPRLPATHVPGAFLPRTFPRWSNGAVAATVLFAYAVLRLLLVRATRLNSDEPQHAHVAWAWAHGLVPYRDVFDNHVPLFHMLTAPLLRLFGETPDIMYWLRLSMVPLAVTALGLAYWIGQGLWNRRVAVWGVMLAAVFPPYLYVAGEYRTDVLWGVAWLAVLAIAVLGRWSMRRALALGLAIGVAWAVSLKTSLLVAGLATGWLIVHVSRPRGERPPLRTVAASLLWIALGACIVPAMVVGIVAMKGGLAAMRYDVLAHNIVPGLGGAYPLSRLPRMLGLLVFMVASLWPLRSAANASLPARRALVVASAAVYGLLLLGAWPLLSRQDNLPVIPLLTLGLAGWWDRIALPGSVRRWAPAALAFVALGFVFGRHAPLQDRIADYRATLADVLSITTARDPVLDDKGASIFRQRPFYYALETITMMRMRLGSIPDDIPQRLVGTGTHVVWARRLPAPDRAFVDANYLPAVRGIRIAGHDFGQLGAGAASRMRLLLPGRYKVLGGDPSGVSLDDVAYAEPRELGAGEHTLSVTRAGHYLLVWEPAARLFGGFATP